VAEEALPRIREGREKTLQAQGIAGGEQTETGTDGSVTRCFFLLLLLIFSGDRP
jgi:hypothetical protein